MTFDTLLRWGFYAIGALAVIVIALEAVYRWRSRESAPEPVENVREGEV